MAHFDHLIKVVVVGNSGVGKSCLLLRFADQTYPRLPPPATPGVDFKIRRIKLASDGSLVKLQIWDTAGQEKYRAITNAYFHNAAAIVVVYDITDASTLEAAYAWIRQARNSAPATAVYALVGAKSDLDDFRAVSAHDGSAAAITMGAEVFQECSAKTEHNVENCFAVLVEHVVARSKAPKQTKDDTCQLGKTAAEEEEEDDIKRCCALQ